MNKVKHCLIGLMLPVFALTVGCSRTHALNFTQARQFVREHYDEHAIDGVPANYDIVVKNGLVNFDIKKIDGSGYEQDAKINFDISSFSTFIEDTYSLCISTKVLDEIQRFYTSFSSLTLEFLTEVPLDLNYTLSQGNELSIALTSGNAQNLMMKTTAVLMNAFNVLSFISRSQGANIDFYQENKAPLAMVIHMLHGEGGQFPDLFTLIANLLKQLPLPFLSKIDGDQLAALTYEFFMLHDVGIDPKSQSVGDKLLFGGKTNNVGYLSNLDSIFTSTVSGNVIIGNYEVRSYIDDEGNTKYDYNSTTVDNYLIDGVINFDVNVKATFVI